MGEAHHSVDSTAMVGQKNHGKVLEREGKVEARGVWHNEPWIKPNYGKRKGFMPESKVKQVRS